MSKFLKAALKDGLKSTTTWNGALSLSGVGHEKMAKCLEYFAKCGTYTGRDQSAVDADMQSIFADDSDTALKIVFGTRLITRTPEKVGRKNFKESQTGYGRRDEFYKAVTWLAKNKPELLYKNLHLIPIFGCWKDLVTTPLINVLDKHKVYDLFAENIDSDLVKKYLPQIRSSKQARSERDKARSNWAKGFCSHMKISYKEYRGLKTGGKAHVWQEQMRAKLWDKINFNGIPGKAMFRHIGQKGKDGQTVFERHNQVDRLMKWLKNQSVVKFTGYPYELANKAKTATNLQSKIYDLQFESILKSMGNHELGNVFAAIDTSGSMQFEVIKGVSALDICLSMGIAFSMMNTGHFKDHVVGFADTSQLVKLNGGFSDRVKQLSGQCYMGSTNFQSVIDMIVQTRKNHPDIPIKDYPETLLVISDMQFNATGSYWGTSSPTETQTNYETAMTKLKAVGLGSMRIIWWYVNGAGKDFPSSMDDKGVYMIGGFDPVNIKALMGLNSDKKTKKTKKEKEKETPLDGMLNFLAQPIFGLIKV